MTHGYTRSSIRRCGVGAAELWSAVLGEPDRGFGEDQPWTIGEIRQVYDRSAYLEFHPQAIKGFDPLGPPLVLLADEGLGGPLATRIAGSSRDRVFRDVAVGTPCRLRTAAGGRAESNYVLRLGDTIDIELDPAALEPPARRRPTYPCMAEITGQGPVFSRAVDALEVLLERDPEDGLGWLQGLNELVTGSSPPSEIRSLIGWWLGHLDGGTNRSPPIDLLGRGPGATPSGDDILAGLLLALLRTTSRQRHDRVREAGRLVVAEAEERTTDISSALLAQAAQGRAADRFEAALGAIIATEAGDHGWESTVLEAAELGHTSGLDHLVGLLLAVLGIAPEIEDRA